MYKKYKVLGTPFLLFLDGDGNEVDWIYGYSAPPAKFHEKVLKVQRGEETFRVLSAKLSNDPKNVPLMMQVARKHESRFVNDKAMALYKEVLALDPEGRAGTTDYNETAVPCADYADFQIALADGNKAEDPAPFLAFAARRPASPLAREAYRRCSYLFLSGKSKDEAFKFFEDGLAKFPNDPLLTFYYLQRIVRDRDNLDRGIALAREAGLNSSLSNMIPRLAAQIRVLKGDADSAEAAYGPDYIDGFLSTTVSSLQNYAQFWAGQKKNMDSALRAVDLAMALQPDNAYTAYSAAGFYIRANLPEKADAAYGPAYAEKHKDDAQALALYASFWSQQKKHPESVAAAEAAARLKPDDPNILQMAARALIAWDKKDQALAIVRTGDGGQDRGRRAGPEQLRLVLGPAGHEPRERPGGGAEIDRARRPGLDRGHARGHPPRTGAARRGPCGREQSHGHLFDPESIQGHGEEDQRRPRQEGPEEVEAPRRDPRNPGERSAFPGVEFPRMNGYTEGENGRT